MNATFRPIDNWDEFSTTTNRTIEATSPADLVSSPPLSKEAVTVSHMAFCDQLQRHCSTDADRIRRAWHELHGPIYGALKDAEFTQTGNGLKSKELSIRWKEAGNSAYGSGDNKKAMTCYNNSIRMAPQGDRNELRETEISEKNKCFPELALAFSNRSLIFFRQKKYEHCLKDIKRAMEAGYPLEMRFKLQQREAECYSALGKHDLALWSFKKALSSCHNNKRHLKIESEIDQLTKLMKESLINKNKTNGSISKKKGNKAVLEFELDIDAYDPVPWQPIPAELADGANPQLPASSNAIKLEYSATKGRHFISRREIKPGEVLFIENAYVHTLRQESQLLYCNNCMRHCSAPIPCRYCTVVVFCSDKCLNAAWESYHRRECHVLPLIRVSHSSESDDAEKFHLAEYYVRIVESLRVLLFASPKLLLELWISDYTGEKRGFGDHASEKLGFGNHAGEKLGISDHTGEKRGFGDHAGEKPGLGDEIGEKPGFGNHTGEKLVIGNEKGEKQQGIGNGTREKLQVGNHTGEKLVTISHACERPQLQRGFDENVIFRSDSYLAIHDADLDVKRIEPHKIGELVILSCLLVKLLRKTDFYQRICDSMAESESVSGLNIADVVSTKEGELSPFEAFIGGLCLRNRIYQDVYGFAHVFHLAHSYFATTVTTIGGVLYSSISLMNHSCYPNANSGSYHGTTKVVRAMRTIRAGEEVTISYGPRVGKYGRENDTRSRYEHLLGSHYFECRCEACDNNWPAADKCPMVPVFLCPQCHTELPPGNGSVKCGRCKSVFRDVMRLRLLQQLEASKNTFSVAVMRLKGYDDATFLRAILDRLHLMETNVAPPWRELVEMHEFLHNWFQYQGALHRDEKFSSLPPGLQGK